MSEAPKPPRERTTNRREAGDQLLKAAILAYSAELLMQPPSPGREKDLAACDRLLERLA
jgi:hypothetical protein